MLSLDGLEQLFETDHNQVKWDFNLSRLSYFVAGDSKQDRFRDLQIIETFTIDGRAIESRWEVRHCSRLGLPGTFDRDVWIGILQIVNEGTDNGQRPVPDVIDLGSTYSFLKRIGKPNTGKYAKMLRDSIERLATTGCITKGAFNCPTSGGYLHLGEVFHLIRSWGFKGSPKTGGGANETNFVTLDPIIRKNLDAFYVSLLRVDYMRSLKGDITKSLYPLLSYRFWQARKNGQNQWRVHWSQLVTYIALKGIDSLKRAKDTLKPALQELKLKEYTSAGSEWDGEYYNFLPGVEHAKEHHKKVLAKDKFLASRSSSKPPTSEYLSAVRISKQTITPKVDSSNARAIELNRQVARLQLGKTLITERLEQFSITPDEVHSALRKEQR